MSKSSSSLAKKPLQISKQNYLVEIQLFYDTMTITTDKVIVNEGTDFTFVCKKIPFAISCMSEMPSRDANLVDLDLINKMGITLRDIKVTRMSLLGHNVRAVGRIKQTIQCVSKGRVQGTIHLEAKVVRDLYTILGADCIASARTYSKLMGKKPPDPSDDDLEEEDTKEPMINLGGVDEDKEEEEKEDQADNAPKIDNNKDKEKEKPENEAKTAFCDEDRPNHIVTSSIDVCYAHEKWKLVPENIRGIEISAYSNGYDVSSEMAIYHAKALHEYDMLWWEEEYDAPLEPFDYNPEAKKFCRTCSRSKQPESVWQNHHTSQLLACPSIPIKIKKDLVETFKRGEM